jgi:hypothetical protein
MSPATPSPASTSWQNPCVVAIVAASNSASPRARRSRRFATSSGGPSARSLTTSSPSPVRSPRSVSTRRWRTRSRSSPVAIRVKVTSRSSFSGVPSAM